MGTKKKFTPEELKHLQANPLHAAGDGRQHILHPRFQGGVLGAQSPGLHWHSRLPQAGL